MKKNNNNFGSEKLVREQVLTFHVLYLVSRVRCESSWTGVKEAGYMNIDFNHSAKGLNVNFGSKALLLVTVVFLKKKQTKKTTAKGDLQMLAIHPPAPSPVQWRPLATLPSLQQPGCQVFPALQRRLTETVHSPFELVAWVVLQLSVAAFRSLLSIGPPEPLLLISEQRREGC